MSKQIPTTKGRVAIVDDEDFDHLSQFKWQATKFGNCWYAVRYVGKFNGKNKRLLMHREILDAQPGQTIDHRDANGLNNTRANLRFCTQTQNLFNKAIQSNNKSGEKGVSWSKERNRWVATLYHNRKCFPLGRYKTFEEAVAVRRRAAEALHGEFFRLK